MPGVPITKIQKFCTHDGPGIRTTVFFKGCPLRCAWCHNPETQSAEPDFFYNARLCVRCGRCAAVCPAGVHVISRDAHEMAREKCAKCMRCAKACPSGAIEACAREMSVEEIFDIVKQDRAFYAREGGMTLSGGEPMAHPEAALALLTLAKSAGISTAVETCGFFDDKWLEPLARAADLLLWDFKDGDEARHKLNTGASGKRIIANLLAADALGARTRLRCIMVRGVNMDEANFAKICEVYDKLKNCEGAELLPYHAYGGSKSASLGRADDGRADWVPQKSDIRFARDYMKTRGVRLI